MKQTLLFIFLLLSYVQPAISNSDTILAFEVRQQSYQFSTIFDLTSNKGLLGTVVKSSFRIRTNYDVYDAFGIYEGVGVCRILTLGSFYKWGTEIDVYDKDGYYAGMVDGQAVTGASAKFSIYDAQGIRVGIAYLDLSNSAFTIVDPNNEQRHIAGLKRNFIENVVDHWSVKVYDPTAIDLRIIKIFAAFAVDSQASFKPDL